MIHLEGQIDEEVTITYRVDFIEKILLTNIQTYGHVIYIQSSLNADVIKICNTI